MLGCARSTLSTDSMDPATVLGGGGAIPEEKESLLPWPLCCLLCLLYGVVKDGITCNTEAAWWIAAAKRPL